MAPKLEFLVDIVKRFDGLVHVVGPITIKNDVESMGALFFEWSLATERDHMGAFHIGFMPLFDDRYTKGKCAFKIVEYGAYGIPSVASKVGANVDVVVQGETGFLVETDEDWEEALQKLLMESNLAPSECDQYIQNICDELSKNEYNQMKIDGFERILKSMKITVNKSVLKELFAYLDINKNGQFDSIDFFGARCASPACSV